MLRATETLKQEHRYIEQVLGCLETMLTLIAEGERPQAVSAAQTLAFLHDFADGSHHDKEERLLFPALEAHGFSPESGPTAIMREEHRQGRDALRALNVYIPAAAAGDRASMRQVLQHGRLYITLQRTHMRKEDRCLFELADDMLPEEEQEALAATFARVAREDFGTERHADCLAIADQLAARFGIPRLITSDAAL